MDINPIEIGKFIGKKWFIFFLIIAAILYFLKLDIIDLSNDRSQNDSGSNKIETETPNQSGGVQFNSYDTSTININGGVNVTNQVMKSDSIK